MTESEFSPHQASSSHSLNYHITVIRPHVICQVRKTKNTQARVTDDLEKQAIPCTAGVNILKYSLAPWTNILTVHILHFLIFFVCISFNSGIPFLEIYPKEIHRQEYKDYIPKYFLKNVYNIADINLNGHTKNPTIHSENIYWAPPVYLELVLSYRYRKSRFKKKNPYFQGVYILMKGVRQ